MHINNKKTKTFYLCNLTPVPAKWKLNYVKFPKKKIISTITLTRMEIENMKIVDDPSVWEFSITEVYLIQSPPNISIFIREYAKVLQCRLIRFQRHWYFPMKLQRIE